MSANSFSNSAPKSPEGAPGGVPAGSRGSSPVNLLNLTPSDALVELSAFLTKAGEPAYRARQILRHLWVKPVATFADMSDLPLGLREKLAVHFSLPRLAVDVDQQSS